MELVFASLILRKLMESAVRFVEMELFYSNKTLWLVMMETLWMEMAVLPSAWSRCSTDAIQMQAFLLRYAPMRVLPFSFHLKPSERTSKATKESFSLPYSLSS